MNCAYCGHVFLRDARARFCWDCDAAASVVMWEAYFEVRRARKDGRLPPITSRYCVDCGKFARFYDHRDYFKPIEVDPVCGSCHQFRGSASTFLNNVQHFRVAA